MSRSIAGAPSRTSALRGLQRTPARWFTRRTALAVSLRVVSVLLMLGIWQLVSAAVTADVLPTPLTTLGAVRGAYADGYVWQDMLVTSGRILAAFALAMLVSVVFGMALGVVGWFGRMFDFWVTISASIPSLLYIVVAYLWFGLNESAAIVATALVVAPSATFNVLQGVKSLDPQLSEMARAYGISRWITVRRVLLPQTLPFLFAAGRTSLALTWKIVIFVELMGRSSGVGYRIQYWYNLFRMDRVLASALPFMLVMLVVELIVIRRLETFLFRWRRAEAG
jgi:NitT/TauT family transport system permease protein